MPRCFITVYLVTDYIPLIGFLAKTIFNNSDVVTGCASKYIREIGDEKDYFKAGASIPIYGVTESGKRFLKMRIDKIGGLKEKKNPKIPEPLI